MPLEPAETRPTIMDKSLGTLLRFRGVFQFTQVQPLPSPPKQCWMRVSLIFSELFDDTSLMLNVRRLCVVVDSLISAAKVCDCVISAWC